MEKETIAYLAGIFDGEGCISLHCHSGKKGYKRLGLQIIVVMIESEIPELLKEAFGGNVHQVTRKATDKIPYTRTFNRWVLAGAENLKSALNAMYPYVIGKKQEFDIALKFAQSVIDYRKKGIKKMTQEEYNYKFDLYNAMKQLRIIKYHRTAATTKPSDLYRGSNSLTCNNN